MKNVGSYPNTRMRRNRKTDWSRRLIRESDLSPNDLIWPIFIRDGKNIKEPIKTMPGVYRYSLDKIEKLVERAINNKIPMIALFPITELSKKNKKGSEAVNKNNLVCKALAKINKDIEFDIRVTPFQQIFMIDAKNFQQALLQNGIKCSFNIYFVHNNLPKYETHFRILLTLHPFDI